MGGKLRRNDTVVESLKKWVISWINAKKFWRTNKIMQDFCVWIWRLSILGCVRVNNAHNWLN